MRRPTARRLAAVEPELRALVGHLGRDGGLVTPSVYDTSQVVRFAPPPEGVEPAVKWLLGRQAADGGWGSPVQPLARHVSTLAAVLALARCDRDRHQLAIDRGTTFLRDTGAAWTQLDPDDLSVGAELLMRRLLLDAEASDIAVDPEPYAAALASTDVKLAAVAAAQWSAGDGPMYIWDAWGTVADPREQSALGDIGTSPSATARWMASGAPEASCARAREYLARAAQATRTAVPGVVPFVYPIDRMEQAFSLYPLALVLDRVPHSVRAALDAQVADLEATFLSRGGVSHSDLYVTDGDDTSVTACVLSKLGRSIDPNVVRRFERDGHFRTYDFEFHPSVSTTAHCVHALALAGDEPPERAVAFLLDRRSADGLWHGDKWHTSWCYSTSQVIIALDAVGADEELTRTVSAVAARQHPDGGFGADEATSIETAFMIVALSVLSHAGDAREIVSAAGDYLVARAGEPAKSDNAPLLWTSKELYRLARLDRSWELAALLACTSDGTVTGAAS